MSHGPAVDQADLFEISEAFASVAIQSMRDLEIGSDVVNVNGGAGYSGNREAAQRLCGRHAGHGVTIHQGNIGSDDDCRRVIEEVLDQHGQLDVLVNNAGVTADKTVRSAGSGRPTTRCLREFSGSVPRRTHRAGIQAEAPGRNRRGGGYRGALARVS
jgi:NAD(P)-dependent dehydrogenase (short-subunit alcohol dehydrogenase family)